VIGSDGEQVGVLPLAQAITKAGEAGLDLVLMSPNAKPPVCKIMDLGKYKYEQSKKANEAKKKQHVVHIKEVKVRASTDTHDLEVKLKRVTKFLQEGNKVKISMRFRGREMVYTERGAEMMKAIAEKVQDDGKIEAMPNLEGRQMIMVLAPLKKS
jgi:translation initiation factor IF-3